ncbi:MAG: hypothetical protein FWD60_10780 [Candidatus Azobacteroides sp.]|nr:hypothetical protein [Candidatus Azobacteroides sp.]
MKKNFLKHFCLLLVFSIAGTAYSQDCGSYLQQAAKLVSQKKYCDAKSYYQKYSDCNADADVSAEIAMCERYCKVQAMEAGDNETIDKTGDPNPLGAKAVVPDVIILKNGDEVKSIVQEVGTEYVKYKKFDNQTGPVYNMAISEIFMIRYANGSKDVFNKIADTSNSSVQNNSENNHRNQNVSVSQNENKEISNKTPEQAITPTAKNANDTQYANSNQPVYKYMFGNAINPVGAKKSPFLAGFLSFIIPGVGQFYTGDIGGGFLCMGTNIICNTVWMTAKDNSTFTIGFVSALVIEILATTDAWATAKNVNRARGYYLGKNAYLNVNPTLLKTNDYTQQNFKNSACGISFTVSF